MTKNNSTKIATKDFQNEIPYKIERRSLFKFIHVYLLCKQYES